MFYLTTHSRHFIYGYMASDIWLGTILIAREETCCRHMGYSFRLASRVLLYAPSLRQDSTYHSLCYTSRGALFGTRNSSTMRNWSDDPSHHERTLLPRSYILLPFNTWLIMWVKPGGGPAAREDHGTLENGCQSSHLLRPQSRRFDNPQKPEKDHWQTHPTSIHGTLRTVSTITIVTVTSKIKPGKTSETIRLKALILISI